MLLLSTGRRWLLIFASTWYHSAARSLALVLVCFAQIMQSLLVQVMEQAQTSLGVSRAADTAAVAATLIDEFSAGPTHSHWQYPVARIDLLLHNKRLPN